MKRNEGIHRHDISGEARERIKELLPGQAGKRGGAAKDMPPESGNRNSVHKRFCRRRDRGIGKTPADAAAGEPAGGIFMIDSMYIKACAGHKAALRISAAQKSAEQQIALGS
jgi:hypothetical protein